MITKSELTLYANNRTDFHALLVRNGFLMPHIKSKAAMIGFLYEVFRGNAWLPRQTEVHSRQIANAPVS